MIKGRKFSKATVEQILALVPFANTEGGHDYMTIDDSLIM
jgi:hypothetical protein